jgi:ribosomal peptide maturation radical SAM protein 1
MNTKVALISMPVLAAQYPSFQLALLKPTLQREGIDIQTFSMYMYFGTHIGFALNSALSDVRPCLASEWVFSKAAFGDFNKDEEYIEYYRDNLDAICKEANCTIDDLLEVRHKKAFTFLDFCMDSVDWSRFQVIGFSVVFQQMAASIAMARRLKEKYPHIPIIFGGAAFEDHVAKGVFKGCSFIDYLHCGDADQTFPQFIRRLERGQSMEGLPGLIWRKDGEVIFNGRAPNLEDLNTTPIPDFDEYFYAYKQSGYNKTRGLRKPMLPIETARGCWWGSKNHCTFCGLNRAGINFRSKHPDQVLEMLETLSARYGYYYFSPIDNIMDNDYIEGLFGRLAKARTDLKIHYEVRPHFSREQLRLMKRGGLLSVQPGIESFNTHVLKLMNKLTTGMRNVAFTKWCTYYNINNFYNILYGFPGETAEDYKRQGELLPKLFHLQPPYSMARARPERGSPMYNNRKKYHITKLEPNYCYYHIYPEDRFDMDKVSYFLSFEMDNLPGGESYHSTLRAAHTWRKLWNAGKRPILQYTKNWDTIVVTDTRGQSARTVKYKGKQVELFEFLHEPRTEKAILDHFNEKEMSGWLQETLQEFIANDFVLHMDDRYLTLALPKNPYH